MENLTKFAFIAKEDTTLRGCRVTIEQSDVDVLADGYCSKDLYEYACVPVEEIEAIKIGDEWNQEEMDFNFNLININIKKEKKNILISYEDQKVFDRFIKTYKFRYKK
jgi:hypothetical protein